MNYIRTDKHNKSMKLTYQLKFIDLATKIPIPSSQSRESPNLFLEIYNIAIPKCAIIYRIIV
jgi:hypothetical protein